MSQLIGKKGGNLESGYVWLPYIMVDNISEVLDSNFSPKKIISSRYSKKIISSRYSSVIINSKLKKIKKILENIEDFNVTSG